MGKVVTALLVALTSLTVTGGDEPPASSDGSIGVTVTYVDASVSPSSGRPTVLSFEANEGVATVRIGYADDAAAAAMSNPVDLRLDGQPLSEPLRFAGSDLREIETSAPILSFIA